MTEKEIVEIVKFGDLMAVENVLNSNGYYSQMYPILEMKGENFNVAQKVYTLLKEIEPVMNIDDYTRFTELLLKGHKISTLNDFLQCNGYNHTINYV